MNNQLLTMLYEKYYRELYLYIYSLCRDKDTAEDLIQETFLKAILSLHESHTNMRAWLYAVARNLFLNKVKKDSRQVLSGEITEQMGNPDENSPGDITGGISEDILSGIIREEKYKVLYEALDTLTSQKREVLIMQYFSGLSQKEIAAILRLTPENVRILAYRGKKELKSCLEKKGYGGTWI